LSTLARRRRRVGVACNNRRYFMTTIGVLQHTGRLTAPLVRRNGELQPASWDEALSLVADRLGSIKREHGGKAFAFFSCSKATNEVNFLAQKFVRTILSSNNIDNCNRT
jgi:predicted molibdopterin-dependent oxidoreductase YjgC